ncbi:MAG TPA: methyltransferase domain-containing protein [Acidimicrobiales bacterium]|nr:methyltransferase domain-containing protein [Acidimicrobiales bacterium]
MTTTMRAGGKRLVAKAHGAAVVVGRTTGSMARKQSFRPEGAPWLRAMPEPLRRRLRLDPPPPGARKLEIGSGGCPTPGYVHVDVTPKAPGVDLLVKGAHLPVPDAWADELLTVHMIEHVPPPALLATLREWHRVLCDDGVLAIHTPNAKSVGAVLASADDDATFWAAQSAAYGYGHHPRDCRGPADLEGRPDHTVLFTFPVLSALLDEAGFVDVRDVSGQDPCRHFVEWSPFVADLCLEISARRPARSP